MFISGRNPHLTSRFCGVVLDPTTICKNTRFSWANENSIF